MFKTIAFVGAGNMTTSLIGGLIADGYPPDAIWASNPSQEKLEALKDRFTIQITQSNPQAITKAAIVVLAVKPQKLQEVASELGPALSSKLIISIAAGVSTNQLQAWLGNPKLSIVSCMPNTPSLIGFGMTGLYAQASVSPAERALAASIMGAVGKVLWVEKEEHMNLVAAVSGSGPAYFLKVMEALQAGAENLGLSTEQAKVLVLQTALGTAKMANLSQESAKNLRKQVTSSGGMTEKAIDALEIGGIDLLFYRALRAGQQRAQEMATELTH